jgi:hypothetical protein
MAYSPNLGLIEPTPFDPAVANVWGALLNTNQLLVDTAIAGLLSLSVAGSANVSLTSINGAPDQSRNAMFIFSGLLTGNIDVLYPAGKTKFFMVKNTTTGAFTVSLGADNPSSPGTPAGAVAVIPQGTIGIFYSDGTNVYSLFGGLFASPTFTGTATFPDGGTWSNTGISSLTKLGIGMVPTSALDITQNQNSASLISHRNSDGGAAASSYYDAFNGTHQAQFGIFGAGYTTSGVFSADRGFIFTTNGLSIASTGDIRIGVSGPTEKYRFGSDGSFLLGSTTNAGAGSIGASGTITQAYSDMRLKTKLGSVRNAISKIMSLDAFYYRRNKKAVSLGFKGKRDVGLSAQQVQKILPEAIAPAPRDSAYMTIRYERVVVLAIAAIQEQQGQIEALKREVAALKRARK